MDYCTVSPSNGMTLQIRHLSLISFFRILLLNPLIHSLSSSAFLSVYLLNGDKAKKPPFIKVFRILHYLIGIARMNAVSCKEHRFIFLTRAGGGIRYIILLQSNLPYRAGLEGGDS